MISSASAVAALEPGDVIALGVNHQGLGPVQDGDRVRIEIAPIGGFEVGVRDKLARRWESRIDTAAQPQSSECYAASPWEPSTW